MTGAKTDPGVASGLEPERWGPKLWMLLAAVVVVAGCLQSYGINRWPMADDEVPTLVELGLADIGAETFSVPPSQVGRLARTLPVWYGFQGLAIQLLPEGEASYRIPSVACAVITSALVFLVAARWRGLWFALALSLVVNLSQPYVYVAQLNRFYSMPLMMLFLTLAAMWVPRGGLMLLLTGVSAALTVLSHNITVAVFGLAFLAAVPLYLIGRLPARVVWRSGAALAVSLGLYFFYVRPLIAGWNSTGNPTPVLVSYVAHLGVPTVALALLGSALVLLGRDLRRTAEPVLEWWILMFAGGFCVFLVADFNFNPRYFVFFFPAAWMLAAHAVMVVARALGRGIAGAAWYAAVAVMLLPALVSHYQDGSRHNYERAAAVVLEQAGPDEPVLSDDAETISYYLPGDLRRRLLVRTKVTEPPLSSFLLVARSNAWGLQPRYRNRYVTVLAEISTRRFDQFSHVLRVYRVSAPVAMTIRGDR